VLLYGGGFGYGGYGGYGLGGYGLGYGGLGYGGLGYGYGGYGLGGYGDGLGYGSGYSGGSLIVPNYSIPQSSPVQPGPLLPYSDQPNQPTDPQPLPLPPLGAGQGASPAVGAGAQGAGANPATDRNTAKITVITNEGAKVSFEGIESDQTGSRHSFTTKAIPPGTEIRVGVKVDGSSISIGVRAGEKATIDMRK
jgi:uncharacterized protein (TIGR03000 family)